MNFSWTEHVELFIYRATDNLKDPNRLPKFAMAEPVEHEGVYRITNRSSRSNRSLDSVTLARLQILNSPEVGSTLLPFNEVQLDMDLSNTPSKSEQLAARCHDIQTGLGLTEIPEFSNLRSVGMAVKLALHIRGLPLIKYETLKLVSNHFLKIPTVAVDSIVTLLAEVEFVKLQKEGRTIKAILPIVPYYELVYSGLGELAEDMGMSEPEQLSIDLLSRLAEAPQNIDSVEAKMGVDRPQLDRALTIGGHGAYMSVHRRRGRDIAVSPTFFSENADLYADLVAKSGANEIKRLLDLIRNSQGMPLSIIASSKEIAGTAVSDEDIVLLTRLAQDGAVKPPSISTTYSGDNYFMFSPTPSGGKLASTKREIYEKAMAIVSSIRQGQHLANKFAIRSPGAVLYTLMNNLKLGKATTEATQQYRRLVYLRVAVLEDVGNGFSQLRIIDTEENREALRIAYSLINSGTAAQAEVDDDAKKALQEDHSFVESLVAAGELSKRHQVELTPAQELEFDNLFQG